MLKFSIPCIISLLVSSLYNIVDQIFIGNGIGYLGNGATNVVYPITVISLAIALMVGDGCAAHLSLCQGKNDNDGARKSVGNAISLIIIVSLIVTAIFFVFEDSIIKMFGATENNYEYAKEYFSYILIGLPFFMFSNSLNSIIRADGSPKFAMISTFIGCIINIILDPIAIFLLKWGMMGAAVATVAGQIVSALMALYYLFHTKTFKLNKSSFAFSFNTTKSFIPLGISSFLTQISIVVIMAVMNNILVIYGAQSKYGADIPLTVVGIVMKVFQIVIAFVVGIAAGCQPIVGYNYGAGHFGRVKKLLKTMVFAECIIGVIATIFFEIFPMQIINIFGSEDGLYNEFAVFTFRVFLSAIILCCVQKSVSIFLQALGKPVASTGLSLLREFFLCVPLTIILPKFFGIKGALYSAPIADIISFIVTVFIIVNVCKKLDNKETGTYISTEKVSVH